MIISTKVAGSVIVLETSEDASVVDILSDVQCATQHIKRRRTSLNLYSAWMEYKHGCDVLINDDFRRYVLDTWRSMNDEQKLPFQIASNSDCIRFNIDVYIAIFNMRDTRFRLVRCLYNGKNSITMADHPRININPFLQLMVKPVFGKFLLIGTNPRVPKRIVHIIEPILKQ